MPTEAKSLPPQPGPAKLIDACGVCGKRVLKAVDHLGSSMVIELCTPGKGNIGLVAPLLGTDQVEAFRTTATATRYRVHRCGGTEAFSAANFKRKKPGAGR